MADRLKNFISGRWVESQAGEYHDVHNPATGELLAQTPLCSADEVDKAVQAAKALNPAVVIPIHHAKADPQEFKKKVEAKTNITVVFLQIGETYQIR